ncbi:MAG: nucleotide exchange factor GrpE [Clostridia bacterium]|nr:nucleotide exchange factor GrpE [Clostridia bacterium]
MKKHETPATDETLEQELPQEEIPAEEAAGDQLQEQLNAANARADEYLALAQRVQADFENFRRRNESVRADAFAEGQRTVAAAMLAVLDNLERAVDANATTDLDALRAGIDLTLRQMRDAYAKLDVQPIDRLGEAFDPALESAVLQGSEDEGEPGTVCAVLQKGYTMGKHVLRYAMVKVVPE